MIKKKYSHIWLFLEDKGERGKGIGGEGERDGDWKKVRRKKEGGREERGKRKKRRNGKEKKEKKKKKEKKRKEKKEKKEKKRKEKKKNIEIPD